jgi:hypothetical protein
MRVVNLDAAAMRVFGQDGLHMLRLNQEDEWLQDREARVAGDPDISRGGM